MRRLQVLEQFAKENESSGIVIAIDAENLASVPTILYLADIDKRNKACQYGWMLDTHMHIVCISQPWEYRDRIDVALGMLKLKYDPSFTPALELRRGEN